MRRAILKGIGMLALVVLAYGICKTPTYAACNFVFGNYICQNGDTCGQAGGCLCSGNPIVNGQACVIVPTGPIDGTVGSSSYGQTCNDGDGCNCGNVGYSHVIAYAAACTRNTVPPTLTAGTLTPGVGSASFSFNSDLAGTITYQGSCGVGSLANASAGANTTNFTLANGTYSDCAIKVTDSTFGNISSPLSIPAFVLSAAVTGVTPPAPSGGGGTRGGGGASYSSFSSDCTTSDVVCTDGKYIRKDNSQCFAGLTGKPCAMDLTGIVAGIKNLTMNSLADLIDSTKNNKTITTISEVTIQGVKIKFYVPKYKTTVIRNVIASLNSSIRISIANKLKKVSDPSYLVENYNLIGTDVKLVAYKEIGTLMKQYNDFLAVFYLIIDKGRSDLLPIGQYQLKAFLKDYISFKTK